MSIHKIAAVMACTVLLSAATCAQQIIEGKVFDADSREPLADALVTDHRQAVHTQTDGRFIMKTGSDSLFVSCPGYLPAKMPASGKIFRIALKPNDNMLEAVVVSANRDAAKRTEAPVAIARIHSKLINETKATSIDQLVNKISGVYMVNLGNEQHAMGIRQPLGTRSLFLYLEDGIPVRTSGVFNHNALMEMNMAAVSNIEVIKGPSSSLYGGEAIGGAVNMITLSPSALPSFRLNIQGNNIGYKRADLQSGFTKGKWGFAVSGYYTNRKGGFIEFTDFRKVVATARIDYRFSEKTKLENSITWMDYYSDMTGSVDSAMFANKKFTSQQTFTYRKARTLRHRSSLVHDWNKKARSGIHLVYRDNSLGQNPAYRVREDYRRQGAGFVGNKEVAHGEINDNSFRGYVLMVQHRQHVDWLNATLVAGATLDASPNTAIANYIRISKDTAANKYVSYQDRPDSLLVNYRTGILNFGSYANLELSPLPRLRLVASLRFDAFRYDFDNYLPVSSVSGSPDTISHYSNLSPKLGFTYNFSKNRGIYANYSEGFVPPQVSELYRAVKIPELDPSTFVNYEMGGWAEILSGKLKADFSLYYMEGKNSIISVRFDDGTFGNSNAGATLHRGIELGLSANPFKDLQVRFSGSYNRHEFKSYVERGVKYDGNEINNAPSWMHNVEVIYRPCFFKGLRLALEWQKLGEYFMDQANLYTYEGFDVFNLRAGYKIKNVECWVNIINLLDNYYAVNSSRSSFGSSYTPGEPRNFNFGIGYDLGSLFRKK